MDVRRDDEDVLAFWKGIGCALSLALIMWAVVYLVGLRLFGMVVGS